MTHYIVKCRYCSKTMRQCRCPSKDKAVRYDTCDLCAATEGRRGDGENAVSAGLAENG